MPLEFKTLPGKERAGKIARRICNVAGFTIVGGLMLAVVFAPDRDFITRRVVPAVLFGAVGLGGLVNVGLNLWLYRYGYLGRKEIKKQEAPARYWLLFAIFTLLSIAALYLAVLFGTGKLGKHRPEKPVVPTAVAPA
jgi:hypothetical protein